jgi:DNA-binding IclR family transcriptional regulator
MTPKQLAAQQDLKLGTVYHLVNTLLDDGYLVRATGGVLHIGDRLPLLLERLDQRLDPFPELNEELVRLALATGTTAVIGQLVGRQVVIAAVQSFPGAVHQRLLHLGLRGPAHSMAIGKVLIARLPPRQVSELIDDWSLVQLTERTISRRTVLVEAVETAGRRGFGLDLEEGVPGLMCIAAPIWTPVGRPPAAIALGLTPDQFRFEGERLVGLVVDAAWRSSRILGAVPSKAVVPPNGRPHVEPPAIA